MEIIFLLFFGGWFMWFVICFFWVFIEKILNDRS